MPNLSTSSLAVAVAAVVVDVVDTAVVLLTSSLAVAVAAGVVVAIVVGHMSQRNKD